MKLDELDFPTAATLSRKLESAGDPPAKRRTPGEIEALRQRGPAQHPRLRTTTRVPSTTATDADDADDADDNSQR